MQEEKTKSEKQIKVYNRRLDFYWQYISVYTIALLVYALMKGTIIDKTISFVFWDPVVLLLLIFIISTLISLLFEYIKKRSILVNSNSIILKTRNKEKLCSLDLIRRISLSRERRIRTKKPIRLIKIRLKNRRFPLRIRPSAYWNERELVHDILRLKKSLKEFQMRKVTTV